MLAFYGSTKIEGLEDEVRLILKLIEEAQSKQVRRSAYVKHCEDFGRCNCPKGHCERGLLT